MTNDQIKDIALAHLEMHTAPDGEVIFIGGDIYEFARALFAEQAKGTTSITSLYCLDSTILGDS